MADDIPAEAPEIDVDALDDKAFGELKGKMRAELPVEAPQEAKPAPEAAKDQKADDKAPDAATDDDAEPDGKAETVPHGQFHRERERRKAAEAEKQQMADNYQKLLDRTTQLLQVQQPAQQEQSGEPVIPTWDADPLAAGSWTQKELIDLKKQIDRDRAEKQEAQAWQQTANAVVIEFNQAAAADPTIPQAYEALRESQAREYLAMGLSLPEVKAELDRAEREHVLYAKSRNINIGAYIKGLASARGWAPAQVQQDNINTGKTEAEKIEEREATRLASQSLGKGGGAVVNTGITSPQELLDMSDDEFEAYKKKHGSVAHAFRQAS